MQGLKQIIANHDVLHAAVVLARYFHLGHKPVEHYTQLIEDWSNTARARYAIHSASPQTLRSLIKFFYLDLAFTADEQDFFASQHSLMDHVLDYRTGNPLSLAIVFKTLASALGFKVEGVNFPGHFLIRCEFAEQQFIYIDPNNGRELTKADLEALYFSILGEVEQEKMPPEVLLSATCEEMMVRLLHNLKAAYINAQHFQAALTVVEFLVGLCPDDPYERRDRGFLLHQLDCPQVALADYQYFLRQCPHDPANAVLADQVKHLTALPLATFH
ncbi:MAG: tetratricopeptide repeat protein [Paraglaciecola sp.]|nr:tetratricopeptide repeat protein [Paraglaciecola sp.]NCT47682.1 tetratricopeptide repeat protein [Paraglaciecola sp.]